MPKISELPGLIGGLAGDELMPVVKGGVTSRAAVEEIRDISTLAALGNSPRPQDEVALLADGTMYRISVPLAIGKTQMSVPWAVNSSGGNDIWSSGAAGALDAWISVADYAFSVEIEGLFENATAPFVTRFWAKFLVFVDDEYVASEPKAVSFSPNDPPDNRYVIHVETDGSGDGFDPTNCLLANFQLGGQIVFSVFTANSTDNIRWFLRAEVSPLGPGVADPS